MRLRALAGLAAALAAVAVLPPSPVRAGDDKSPGKYVENSIIGFRFRPLNEWGAIPQGTDPNDPKVAAYYSDQAKYDSGIRPECEVYAFKRTRAATTSDVEESKPSPEGPPPGAPPGMDDEAIRAAIRAAMRPDSMANLFERFQERQKDMVDRVWNAMDEKDRRKNKDKQWRWEVRDKELTNGETPCRFMTIDTGVAIWGRTADVLPMTILCGVIENDEYEVGVVYSIPTEEMRRYGRGAMASIQSLEWLDGAEVAKARQDLADALAGKTGDERWIEEVKRKVTDGWAYVQTKNYLIVYDKAVDQRRIMDIARQIEAIRLDVYEVLFPPDRPITAISVVRVCKDKPQYVQYGGSPSSAGYWNSGEKELVFYDDKSKDALRVLNHEAFHQYIFYSVGSISPHDWFNEGHGDFFAGHNYDGRGRFVPKKFQWRGDIKSIIGSKKYVPLKRFMSYTHAEYYGPQIGQNYSQGWSVIWFLRMQSDSRYAGILNTYFQTLKSEVTKYVDLQMEAQKAAAEAEGKPWKPEDARSVMVPPSVEEAARTKALDSVFGNWTDADWERFEAAWKKFL